MKNPTLFFVGYVIALLVSISGAIIKILHLFDGSTVTALGMFFTLSFIFIGIFEVINNRRIQRAEKTMWVLGFLFLFWLAGILYYNRCKAIKINR
ncbi:hypothetical protein [Parabacteroides sp. FAFU027]|uniref:hypothetical protein n=1 Tax=Parabacteroides sp. FAFU027 TaxID=2922715 RepID=UPI001FAEF61F|nr:hypothetical protein [Parabacteroides sp. FAFU027]